MAAREGGGQAGDADGLTRPSGEDRREGAEDASWKDGFCSSKSKYAYPRDDLVKAELVRGELAPAPEWLRPTHKCSAFCIKRNFLCSKSFS